MNFVTEMNIYKTNTAGFELLRMSEKTYGLKRALYSPSSTVFPAFLHLIMPHWMRCIYWTLVALVQLPRLLYTKMECCESDSVDKTMMIARKADSMHSWPAQYSLITVVDSQLG